MRFATLGFAFVVLMLGASSCGGDDDSDARFDITLAQGDSQATVSVEVAATFRERQQGLMLRQEMAEDAGMLFLFPRDGQVGFWMKDTYLPLDIAYISAAGEVLEVRQATPLDETVLTPAQPYRYVLEVNQGWFERHALGVGAKVTLPTGLPKPTE